MAGKHLRQNQNEENTEKLMLGDVVEDDESFLVLSEELRTIYLFGLLNTKLVMRFIKYWDILTFAYNQPNIRKAPITIAIHSDGGGSHDGLALYDKIKSSGVLTQTMAIGTVNSAAIAVFLAGSRRGIRENATILFHQTQPNLCENSDRVEAEREVRGCRRIDLLYHGIILANSNLTLGTIRRFEREQKEICAKEALKYGLAHEIIKNF